MMRLKNDSSDMTTHSEEDELCVAVAMALGVANSAFEDIMVLYDSGVVILSGRLNQYYLKQLAQTIAKSVAGVGLVRNDILVVAH